MKKTPMDDPTQVVLAHEDQESDPDPPPPWPTTSRSTASARDVLESLARLSLASVGGGLVGLALQRQQERQSHFRQPPETATRRKTALRKGPPSLAQHGRGFAHLPRSWAISCFLFTLILEGSRLVSPAFLIYQQLQDEASSPPEARPTTTTRAVLVATDYTLGGTLAGWAAAVGQQRAAASKRGMTAATTRGATGRPLGTFTGILLGTALGLTAGLVQAAVVAAEDYDNREAASPTEPNTATSSATDKQEKS